MATRKAGESGSAYFERHFVLGSDAEEHEGKLGCWGSATLVGGDFGRTPVAAALVSPHHSDPFDRALIATATAEGLTLLTLDKGLKAYSGERCKVIVSSTRLRLTH